MPDNTSDMDLYYQKDLDEYESNILYFINSLKKDIYTIKNNLEEIDRANILKEDNQKIAELQKSMQTEARATFTNENPTNSFEETAKNIK